MTQSKSSPAVQPVFQDCLYIGGVTQDFGDSEPVFCQSPYEVGKYRQVGTIESPPSNVESSLSGRFSLSTRSNLIRVAKAGAPFDVHAHLFTKGENPSVFNQWRQKIIFENVRASSLDIDDLGAHDEDTAVGHSIDFSAAEWFQLLPMIFSERTPAAVNVELIGAYIHYNGELEKPPSERIVMLATSIAGSGSPTLTPDVVYSINGGSTWYSVDIDSATASDTADGVAVVGQYVVVISASTESLHYASLTDFDGVTAPSFTEVTTGFTTGAGPTDITMAGSLAFMCGASGYVYRTTYAPGGVTALSVGAATSEDLNAIHAYDESTIVAVGNNNAVIVALDGENFSAVTGPDAGVNMTAVAVLSENIYLVGSADGKLWYTTNAGVSWTEKSFPSGGTGVIEDIKFSTNLVGFMSHTLSGAGRILMTTDAGYSWTLVPSGGLAAYADKFNKLGVLSMDPNLLMAVGLADDGSDGVIIVGEPSE